MKRKIRTRTYETSVYTIAHIHAHARTHTPPFTIDEKHGRTERDLFLPFRACLHVLMFQHQTISDVLHCYKNIEVMHQRHYWLTFQGLVSDLLCSVNIVCRC